jgi:hypothetical protein
MAVKIDWEIVDSLIEAGCDGVHIAAYYGVHPDTLYNRCKEENKMDFSNYKAEKRAKGDIKLFKAQFLKAIEDKDNTMLIFLGKNRLGQSDKVQNEITMPQLKPVIISKDGKTE